MSSAKTGAKTGATSGATSAVRRPTRRPTLRREKSLMREGRLLVAGCDEVGRGALAGPVTVGMVVVDASIGRVPQGLADSKLISARRRETLVPVIERWTSWHAVAHAAAEEIDRWGLTVALRLAGQRALATLGVQPDVVLLDGSYDWLSPRNVPPDDQGDDRGDDRGDDQPALWQIDLTTSGPSTTGVPHASAPSWPECVVPEVVTQIKADLACASVAAASVLAKVTRDEIMTGLAGRFPRYAWEENKGYASEWHREQLRQWGPCDYHRRSWRLGVDSTGVDSAGVDLTSVDLTSVDSAGVDSAGSYLRRPQPI